MRPVYDSINLRGSAIEYSTVNQPAARSVIGIQGGGENSCLRSGVTLTKTSGIRAGDISDELRRITRSTNNSVLPVMISARPNPITQGRTSRTNQARMMQPYRGAEIVGSHADPFRSSDV